MKEPDHSVRRQFAVSVVQQLVDAGFTAVWAGGCVRDELLGRIPKDYDVATSATPDQVIQLFGKRRTVPVGASFGVIMVLGPSKACGQIEVATFRSDGEYLDGRRPESIQFCSPEEDALRRDFTINGMFFDPLTQQLLDYVEGQNDLQRHVIRAIGDAEARFEEDKLRMLRAIRFTATFHFDLDQQTAVAIHRFRDQIQQVSVERIAAEMRRMMSHPSRATAIKLLQETGLLSAICPFLNPDTNVEAIHRIMEHLKEEAFEPSFAALLSGLYDSTLKHPRQRSEAVRSACHSWKLSNAETDSICWILDSAHQCKQDQPIPLHVLKPILADQRNSLVIDFLTASAVAGNRPSLPAYQLVGYLATADSELLNPDPLISGKDLFELGVPPGPCFADLISKVRRLQLDEVLKSPQAARDWVKRKLEAGLPPT